MPYKIEDMNHALCEHRLVSQKSRENGADHADARELYKREFYVLWNSGIAKDDDIDETVVVCIADMDAGSSRVTRVFGACAQDINRAEDKCLSWLKHDNHVRQCGHLKLILIMNMAPFYGFSVAFTEFKLLLDNLDIHSDILIKLVKISNHHGDDPDFMEIKEGISVLHGEGIKISGLNESDWMLLRKLLVDRGGIDKQMKQSDHVTNELQQMLSDKG